METTFAEAVRACDPAAGRSRADAPVLAGLARWGAGQRAVLSMGLPGRRPDEQRNERGALVAVAGARVAIAAASGPEDPDEVVWTTDVEAVRELLGGLADEPEVSSEATAVLRALPPEQRGADLTALVDGMTAIVAADRQLLAAALHDGPVQHLTAAQLLLDSAMWSGQEIPSAAREPIEQGLAALLEGIKGCRDLMRRLAESSEPAEDG